MHFRDDIVYKTLVSAGASPMEALESMHESRRPRRPRDSYKVTKSILDFLGDFCSESNRHFARDVGFPFAVFIKDIYKPLKREIRSRAANGDRRFVRDHQISLLARVVRLFLWLRGVEMYTLTTIFGQARQTIDRDLDKLVEVAAELFAPLYIIYPARGSLESFAKREYGAFSEVAGATYAGDMTHFPIYRPKLRQKQYYRADKKCHCVQAFTICDGGGLTCMLKGPFTGSMNDKTVMKNPRLRYEIASGLDDGSVILYDKGLGRGSNPPFLAAVGTGGKKKSVTAASRASDKAIYKARYQVEHTYAWLKNKWKRLSRRNSLGKRHFNAIVLAFAMTNLYSLKVSPVKNHRCFWKKCRYCKRMFH